MVPSRMILGYTPATSSITSSNLMLAPKARSFSSRRLTASLFSTRSVLRKGRITRRVSSSLAATMACFTLSCTGASLVAIKRVPMLMPSAPSASAATRERPSAMPPEATNGIFSSSAARGSRMKLGTSSSPGWPPHSKPSTLTASQPIASALSECRTDVHLWITLMPASCRPGNHFCGLLPAVSTTFTPPSTMALI